MEWVEVAGKTINEATEQALYQLGVAEADAEIIVVSEPKPGLFGRMRGEARVRARVRPVGARPKRERSRRSSRSASGDSRRSSQSQRGSAAESSGGSAGRDGGSLELWLPHLIPWVEFERKRRVGRIHRPR